MKVGNVAASEEKLVRSKIPELIRQQGMEVTSRLANPEELWALLLAKLGEETRELVEASSEEQVCEEIADILEVLDALQRRLGPDASGSVQIWKRVKLEARGPFENVVLAPPYRGVPKGA